MKLIGFKSRRSDNAQTEKQHKQTNNEKMKRQRLPNTTPLSHNFDEHTHTLNEATSRRSNEFIIVEGQFDDASTSSPDIEQEARSTRISTTVQSPLSKKYRNLVDGDNEDDIEIEGRKSQDEEVQPNLVSFEETSPKDDKKDLRDLRSQFKTKSSQSSSINYNNQTSQSDSPYRLHWQQQQQYQQRRDQTQHGPSMTSESWDPLIHELGSAETKTNIGANMPPLDNVARRIPIDCSREQQRFMMPLLLQNQSDDQTNQPDLKTDTSVATTANANTHSSIEGQDTIKLENIDPQLVTTNDVLMGRGGGTNRHNVHFRQMVADAQPQYIQARKKEKTQISKSIVAKVRNQGGRFLKMGHDGFYFDVGDKLAASKTSQALREGLAGRMREIVKASSSLIEGAKEVHTAKFGDNHSGNDDNVNESIE